VEAIRVADLVKRYKSGVTAVDGVSFSVHAGEIFALLGPNGAGKSTTVGVLTTLQVPTSGTVHICGHDVVAEAGRVRSLIGVALQDVGLDALMKPTELLAMQARLFGASRQEAEDRGRRLLAMVGLSEAADRRAGQFSGGMRRRLDLALALAHEPRVLFLDEPTTGLDPASRRDIWAEVRRLNRVHGMTVLLTTQYLEEADVLADRVAIMDRGRIVAEGTPESLKAGMGREAINLTLPDEESVSRATRCLAEMVQSVQAERLVLRLYLDQAAPAVPAVVARLQEEGIPIASLTLSQPTLDDVFLSVTGQALSST
jgi:ABC-2 type transport system ATP-binding protein